jgi:hypothetical protein
MALTSYSPGISSSFQDATRLNEIFWWNIHILSFASEAAALDTHSTDTMKVIVDDNDPLVQYNFFQPSPLVPTGWAREGKAPEFDSTTHASATPGDTAKLTFNGVSIPPISHYGTALMP